MRVFLSWSGERSKAVAAALRDWLPLVIQSIKPWFSPEDIDAGHRWSDSIARELQESAFGIICVTPENKHRPWLNFEAGALAKAIDQAKVVPYLVGMTGADLDGPLAQFQAKKANREDTESVVKSLALSAGHTAPTEAHLNVLFDRFWPDLEKKIGDLPSPQTVPAQRNEREMLEEILSLVREFRYEAELGKAETRNQLDHLFEQMNKRATADAVAAMLRTQMSGSTPALWAHLLSVDGPGGRASTLAAALESKEREKAEKVEDGEQSDAAKKKLRGG
jgi:hypothetical protein